MPCRAQTNARQLVTHTCNLHKDAFFGTSKIKVITSIWRHIDLPFRRFLYTYACVSKMRFFSTIVLQALALTVSCRTISRAAAQPVVDLGYAIHQATLNVSYQTTWENLRLTIRHKQGFGTKFLLQLFKYSVWPTSSWFPSILKPPSPSRQEQHSQQWPTRRNLPSI